MKVKFKTKNYVLLEMSETTMNDGANMLSFLVDGDYGKVADDVSGSEAIEVTNDDKSVDRYLGYDTVQSVATEDDHVRVVVSQPLSQRVFDLLNVIRSQEDTIRELTESQSVQDLAIEDLGQAVSDLEG